MRNKLSQVTERLDERTTLLDKKVDKITQNLNGKGIFEEGGNCSLK